MRNIFSSTSTSPTSSHHSSTSTPPHTLSSSIMEEKMESAESVITKWDISESISSYTKIASLFAGEGTDSIEFLRAVEDLQSTMKHFVSQKSRSTELVRCQNLMQIAIKRLEKEFYQILSSNRNIIDSESISSRSSRASKRLSVSDNDEDESVESSDDEKSVDTFMSDLKSIADCMISTGYGKECVKLYKLVRKSVVDETLYHLGVDSLSLSQVQKMEWDVMELKIKQWVKAIMVAIKKLFIGERILCDQVFAGSDRIREACFSEISVNGGLMLFLFPENVAKCRKSPEKMFRLLDLYMVISDNLQEIESIFSFKATSTVRSQALTSLLRLGDAVRSTLSEFEAAIQKEVSKSVLPGGGVHPLTRYVMNYFVFLSDYSGALDDILEDHPHTTAQASLPDSYFSSTSPGNGLSSETSLRFAWIILVLLCKLDGKSQMYKDVSMSYLFLTNNLNYVVSKVQSSPLTFILGNEWVTNHDTKVRQYAANFERMEWAKVVATLPNNPTAEISINNAMACFDKFNAEFEETYRKHSSWVVADPELRDEIKVSIANRVVPVYTKFYEQNRGYFRREVGVVPIVKYTPEDLENYFDDLYCQSGGSRTSHSSAASSPSRDKKGSWH